MKTKILLLLLAFVSLSGCDRDNRKIWDVEPTVVLIKVVDAKGDNLLDPAHSSPLDVTKIKAIYKGKEYPCNQDAANEMQTRDYLPHFYGLITSKYPEYKDYLLLFGEFDGTLSYENESVTIVWADGSSDNIRFTTHAKTPEEWFLNDVKIDIKASRYRIIIVK